MASKSKSQYRIGVDVGGTNTDSVIIDLARTHESTRGVVATFKHATTPDVTVGIEAAVRQVLRESGVRPESGEVLSLTVGTTHFVNAVVQSDSRRLARVAVIRLGAPYSSECPAFIDFPPHLERIMNGHTAILKGGFQIDGRQINPISEPEIVEQAHIIKEKGLKAVVVAGIFSPLDIDGIQEYRAREILLRELGTGVDVVCSRDVGQVGFLERESASILNASIMSYARKTIRGFKRAMRGLGLGCALYLTQNDGTLITSSEAARLPIKTFSSGPTNSMRGASYLAGIGFRKVSKGVENAEKSEGKEQDEKDEKEEKEEKDEHEQKSTIVVDIGGTTTDVGVLLPSGFPRQAAAFIEVAGVRTNFSMPDVHSIGLGGGSRVRTDPGPGSRSSAAAGSNADSAGTGVTVSAGPDSVGHLITEQALVFGGDTITATDIAIAESLSSSSSSANPSPSKSGLRSHIHSHSFTQPVDIVGIKVDPSTLKGIPESTRVKALERIQRLLEGVIDRMKTSPEECDVLLVGGGSIVAPKKMKGVRKIITPPFHEVANAVGAAVASVSGEVDTIEILQGRKLSDALEGIKARAVQRAVDMGAQVETTRVVEVNVIPIQYVTNQATRIVVRAVGELGVGANAGAGAGETFEDINEEEDEEESGPVVDEAFDDEEKISYAEYKPTIVGNEWVLTETDLKFIMEGCGVLGTGGGGSPYPAYLIARQILRSGKSIRIIDHKSLPDDGYIVRGGYIGSPSVGYERLRGPPHLEMAGEELAKYCGITKFHATLCDEIGGGNGMQSLIMSAQYDIPALDGDLMGRAYPKLNQVLPAVYDRPNSLVPCSLCDGDGNVALLTRVKNEHFVESIMRVVTTEMGSSAALCPPPILLRDARDYGVTRSESQAWRVGRAISICRETNNIKGVAAAILELQNGVCLFVGKIIEVSREVRAGFTWGQVRITPLQEDELEEVNTGTSTAGAPLYSDDPTTTLLIPFQNENLCAYLQGQEGPSKIVGSVPDLIIILDSQSGSHLGTPEYAYGLRVTVLCIAGHPLWGTARGLDVGGPQAFELEHTYQAVDEYLEPRSVIEEYDTR